MFDATKYNIILLTDFSNYLQKTVGPYKVACELRRAGYEVFVLNHLHMFAIDEIKNILRTAINSKTLYVGVSGFFYKNQIPGSVVPHGKEFNAELKRLIHECNSNVKLVMGGPDSEDKSYISDYDYVVSGYGDVSAVNLADHLAHGAELLRSRRSLFGPTLIENIKSEGYDFVNTPMVYADHDFILPGETLTTEVSRGCIFSCSFCAFPLNGKKKFDYIKNFDVLRNEFIDNYKRFGVTRYIFSDDTFNDSVEKVEFLHRVSESLPFTLEYWAYLRLDLLTAHPQTIDLLFESGLRGAFFGIETMDEHAGAAVGKGGKRDRMIQTLHDIRHKYGDQIHMSASFIFGLPGETVDSMRQTGNRLVNKDIPVDYWNIGPLAITDTLWKSSLDITCEQKGYRIIRQQGKYKIWQSDLTSYDECLALAQEFENHPCNKRSTIRCFSIAGLGFDLGFAFHSTMQGMDSKIVNYAKRKRFLLYKSKVYSWLGI